VAQYQAMAPLISFAGRRKARDQRIGKVFTGLPPAAIRR